MHDPDQKCKKMVIVEKVKARVFTEGFDLVSNNWQIA